MKCPIERDGVPIAELYTEYTFDAIDQSLPQGFYGQRAVLYLMDAATERFVLKPEGMGEARDAGHVNLEDFYRANNIHRSGHSLHGGGRRRKPRERHVRP